jgi:hypothetical protein
MYHRGAALGVLLAAGLALGGADLRDAAAEGLALRDGLWETTMRHPMLGEHTSRECLKDAVLDPQTMLDGQDDCQMTEQTLEGNTLTFKLTCAGGSGTAEGRVSVDGDRGTMEFNMHFEADGQPMSMSMSWDTTRVGDC